MTSAAGCLIVQHRVPVAVYLLYLVTADRFRMGRLIVWVGFLALIAIVLAVEMTIQRLWPDGG